jgi:hypothetical protein
MKPSTQYIEVNKVRRISFLTFLCFAVGFAQKTELNLASRPVPVDFKFHRPVRKAAQPRAQTKAGASPASTHLAFYKGYYTSLGGKQVPFDIVGTDPALGAATTTIPVVLIPLKFVFPDAGNPVLDGTNVIPAIVNSPIFQAADYKAGPVDLGVTQYGDALQGAQFWNLPGFSRDYHVLLGTPSIAPTVTVVLPPGLGTAVLLSTGKYAGSVDDVFFEQLQKDIVANHAASELPIFVTDNVLATLDNGGCCVPGYHQSHFLTPDLAAHTWIYSAYTEPGTFGLLLDDVGVLSHEIAEWLNDPFDLTSYPFDVSAGLGSNFIPPALEAGFCQPLFEVGDPLSAGQPFTKVTNSTKYTLVDDVFLSWYLHTPSFSVNGWNTSQNTSAPIPLTVNSPPSVAGSYKDTARLSYGPVDSRIAGDVVYLGRGCPAGSIDGTNPDDPYLANPAGNIALVDRGSCNVSLKVDRAAQAGAIACLLGMVTPGPAVSIGFGGGSHFIPSLVITQATSNSIKTALGAGPVRVTINPNEVLPVPPSSLCGPG